VDLGRGRDTGSRGEGVGVVTVDEGSPAWNHGLRSGDVIVGVNRVKMSSVRDLVASLKGNQKSVQLNVVRGDFLLTFVIRR
jgi:S1-C subfamily serine protease